MPAAATPNSAICFYVAANGNDGWSGRLPSPNRKRTDGPFATLEQSQTAVVEFNASHPGNTRTIIVSIRRGTYYLTRPLEMTPADSGQPGQPVIYEAYPGEHPVIAGGERIGVWQRATVHGQPMWITHISSVQVGDWYFTQLWDNGKRLQRPRLPETGYFRFTGLLPDQASHPWNQGNSSAEFAPGDIRADWHDLPDVEIVAFHFWVDSHLHIKSVDEASHLVTFVHPSIFKLTEDFQPRECRFIVENVYEALDRSGQFYLDRRTGTLTYDAPAGKDPNRDRIVAPKLSQLVRMVGTNRSPIHDIILRGLTFAYTEWDLPADSSGDGQAAVSVPGAVYLQAARNCSIEDCRFEHLGGYGVELAAGCDNNAVIRNELHDLGAGAIKVGHDSRSTIVSDNTIYDGGLIYREAVGIWVGNSGDNQIVHNLIHDMNYTAISVGWSWGYGPSNAVNNLIAYNKIYHIGHGVLSDMGGIYTLGVSPGTKELNNLIYNVESYSYGGWGIYLDEGSSDILVKDNIVYRTKSGGLHLHYGRDDTIENNIFALNREAQLVHSKPETYLALDFKHNIIYWKSGPLLSGGWADSHYQFDDNLYYCVGGRSFNFAGQSWDQWRARGLDLHSIIADPQFVNPSRGDFRLKPGSPALKIGFHPIDTSTVGPRPKRPISR